MFDGRIRPFIDPPLKALAKQLVAWKVSADQITMFGCAFGVSGAVAVAFGFFGLAFLLIALGRLADGIDGWVARIENSTSDRGGFLDIALDFVFYAAVPVGFAMYAPAENALAAVALLSGFLINGTAFLAYAWITEKQGLEQQAKQAAKHSGQGEKSFAYLSGLAEGTETVIFFLVVCAFPGSFAWLAYAFAALCWISGLARIITVYRDLS